MESVNKKVKYLCNNWTTEQANLCSLGNASQTAGSCSKHHKRPEQTCACFCRYGGGLCLVNQDRRRGHTSIAQIKYINVLSVHTSISDKIAVHKVAANDDRLHLVIVVDARSEDEIILDNDAC